MESLTRSDPHEPIITRYLGEAHMEGGTAKLPDFIASDLYGRLMPLQDVCTDSKPQSGTRIFLRREEGFEDLRLNVRAHTMAVPAVHDFLTEAPRQRQRAGEADWPSKRDAQA